MGDTLKWIGFSWINVWCGNLSSGPIPAEVPRWELTEEMDRSLKFLSSLSLKKKNLYWKPRVPCFATNILTFLSFTIVSLIGVE